MQVRLDVPETGGITRAALEALAIERMGSGRLTAHQARKMLGISSRYEMDGFLRAHDVFLPVTLAEVIRDSETALSFSR